MLDCLYSCCSLLNRLCPHSPSEKEFSQALLSMRDIHYSRQSSLYILYIFTVAYPQLRAGGKVLTDLITLYCWIHKELKCLVDKSYAKSNGLEEIITRGHKKFPALDLPNVYERVKSENHIPHTHTQL